MWFVTIPIVAWMVCGTLKFMVNFTHHRYDAIRRVGHGGFPSNHTAVVSSVMWFLVLAKEWRVAGLAMAVLLICVFDATGLRREVGRHAAALNRVTGSRLREIMGHSCLDIAGGLVVGFGIALAYWSVGGRP